MKFKNNLNIVRLLAAMLVLYGHSFVFLGLQPPLFLNWLPLGPLGVYIFFSISGYLVCESWTRDPSVYRFLQRRALRIFPALAVCVLLSILVLGPIATTLPLPEYFSSPFTMAYLQNIWLSIVYYLPGVFEHLRHPNVVNGSLWSLPVEFSMYLVLVLIGLLRFNRWLTLVLTLIFGIMCFFWASKSELIVFYNFDVRQIFISGTYFMVGACLYKFNVRNHMSTSNILLAVILLLSLSMKITWLQIASWVLIPFLALSFGLAYSPLLNFLTRSGDYSYGIYIYAFPIQQLVVYFFPEIGLIKYLLVCTISTIFFAVLSWHLIESRALLLKPKISPAH